MSITSINAGQAVIRILGDTREFNSVLNDAKGRLERFTAIVTQMGNSA